MVLIKTEIYFELSIPHALGHLHTLLISLGRLPERKRSKGRQIDTQKRREKDWKRRMNTRKQRLKKQV